MSISCDWRTTIIASGDMLWPLADQVGSIRDLVDDDGDVVRHIEYDSFGNIISDSAPTVEHRFAFTGQEHDAETGLINCQYCDAAVGGHLSDAPLGQ